MNREEALEFIGLKESANNEEIQGRYNQKYEYFQMLYTNAPNKVIKSLQQQNLDKLDIIKQMLLAEKKPKKVVEENWFTSTVIKGYQSIFSKPQEKEALAWLIVHTENKKVQTFTIIEGINYIGRKKLKEGANSIVIDDDPFVSRTHAFIKSRLVSDRFQFELYDGDGNKASANGIYLNGNESKLDHKYYLKDNDTIQIGITKLVFKVNHDSTSESTEIEIVKRSKYMNTVDINVSK